MKNKLLEIGILGIIGYMLFLNSTVINPTLAFIYTILLVVSIAFVLGDSQRQIFLTNKNISWSKAVLIAGISYAVLIALSYFSSSLAKLIPLRELLGLLGASAPVFSNSQFFNFSNFALLIPYLETFAIFVIAIDFFSTLFKIDLNRLSVKLITLFIIISLSFLFFHIQAKGIENEAALLLVFFMAMVSCVLVFLYKEARIPIMFHIIANVIGLLTFSSVSILSVILPLSASAILLFPILIKQKGLKRNELCNIRNQPITKYTSDSNLPSVDDKMKIIKLNGRLISCLK